MRYEISRQNEADHYQQRIVWITKLAVGSVSGLFFAAAILVSIYFRLLTAGVLIIVALLAAWISTKLRD